MTEKNVTVNGLIIKETKYGEGNKILTVLTDSKGKIQVSASGVRSYKSKIASGCGMYSYSKFLLKSGKSMYNIISADSICNFYSLSNNYEKLSYAAYFSELVCAVTVEDDADETLRLMLNTLFYLENNENLELIKTVFELRLMKECGFMPNILSCDQCGSSSALSYFSTDEGVCFCSNCSKLNNINQTITDAMHYVLTADLKRIFSFNIDVPSFNKMKELIEKYTVTQVGYIPKSLIYLKTNL